MYALLHNICLFSLYNYSVYRVPCGRCNLNLQNSIDSGVFFLSLHTLHTLHTLWLKSHVQCPDVFSFVVDLFLDDIFCTRVGSNCTVLVPSCSSFGTGSSRDSSDDFVFVNLE